MSIRFENWRIGQRLLGAFGLLGVIYAGTVIYSSTISRHVSHEVQEVLSEHVPAALGAAQLVADIKAVASETRGYLLTGNAQSKQLYAAAWAGVYQRVAALERLAKMEGNAEFAPDIAKVRPLVDALRKTQDRMLTIAFTPEALPASNLLNVAVQPKAERLFAETQRMIDAEFLLEASMERKHLLKSLSDMQGQFASALSHLRAFLDRGRTEDKNAYWLAMIAFRDGYDMVMGRQHLLTENQAAAFEAIGKEIDGLQDDLAKVIAARERPDWNLPVHLMRTEGMPRIDALMDVLDGVLANGARQGGLDDLALARVEVDTQSAMADMSTMIRVQLGVLAAVLLLGAAIAYLISRSISLPVGALTAAMGRLKDGDTSLDIPGARRGDEIGQMARAVEVFRDAAIAKTKVEQQAAEARQIAEADRARAAEEQARLERAAADERARVEEMRRKAAEEEAVTSRERQHAIDLVSTGLARMAAQDMTFRLVEDMPAAYRKLQSDFNSAAEMLESALLSVRDGTSAIRAGSQEISNAADDLSRRTEQQAASLEETSAALAEITGTVRKAAEGASHARDVVAAAKSDAAQSGEVVRRTVKAMSGIEKSSNEISQIIGVIDEIAFQTNLLALNAGVEAARAGEAGRGFAVVATEVRALAQRSAEAARQIKSLISSSSTEVEQGVKLVSETGVALERIISRVAEIDSVVASIANGAQEQANGLQQVNIAVGQMDQNTQQNAAMVEQSTAACRALGEEAARLDELVTAFRVSSFAGQVRSELEAVAPHVFARNAPAQGAARDAGSQRKAAAAERSAATSPRAVRREAKASAKPARTAPTAVAANDGGWEEF